MTTLFKHQSDFLMTNPNRSALVWSCGTGKTRTAVEWANITATTTLIICPKALKANWEREISRWATASGSAWSVMTKEDFRKNAEVCVGFHNVIVDEVHNGFLTPHFKSQMSKALRNYLKKHTVPRVLLLSATVYTSSPWNIYQLATLLGYKWDWMSFSFKYFNQIRMGPRIIPVAKPGVEAMLAEEVKRIASVVNIYDVIDVPLQNHLEPEYFALNKGQEKAIKDNYDPLPIVRYTARNEIENGILLPNDFREAQIFDCDKNSRILSLVEENPKIAIICRYNMQIDVLHDLLVKNGFKPSIIRGDVKDRDKVCLDAEASEKAVVLIQADCSEGYNLPSFPVCVFASMSNKYKNWVQVCGRFLRQDKPSPTTFVYLLTEGESVDQGIYDAIQRKEDFSIALYAKNN